MRGREDFVFYFFFLLELLVDIFGLLEEMFFLWKEEWFFLERVCRIYFILV